MMMKESHKLRIKRLKKTLNSLYLTFNFLLFSLLEICRCIKLNHFVGKCKNLPHIPK